METDGGPPRADEALDVDRAYRLVMDDPRFRAGTRPPGHLPQGSRRFIVEMYERLTGNRLPG